MMQWLFRKHGGERASILVKIDALSEWYILSIQNIAQGVVPVYKRVGVKDLPNYDGLMVQKVAYFLFIYLEDHLLAIAKRV